MVQETSVIIHGYFAELTHKFVVCAAGDDVKELLSHKVSLYILCLFVCSFLNLLLILFALGTEPRGLFCAQG